VAPNVAMVVPLPPPLMSSLVKIALDARSLGCGSGYGLLLENTGR
jgi:hypothetical protein